MKFTQIRNATAKLEYSEMTFLLDPWLQDYIDSEELRKKIQEKRFIGKPVKELPEKPDEILKDVDWVLVTHLHEDHFSEDYLPKDIPILVQNEKDLQSLKNMGFTQVQAFGADPVTIGSVSIHRTTAVHGENNDLAAQMGDVSGYVLESPEDKTVYLMGDTIYTPAIQKNIDQYDPDILVANGCDARVSRGRLIMDEKDILDLAGRNPEKRILVSHMEGVSHAFLNREDLNKAIRQHNLENQIFVPEDGQLVQL